MHTQIVVITLAKPVLRNHAFFADAGAFMHIMTDIGHQHMFQQGFWGLEDEDKTKVRVFINWSSNTAAKGDQKPIGDQFRSLDGVDLVEVYEVDFDPANPHEPLNPRIAHNTMVETIYFDSKFPHRDGWVNNFKQKVRNILRENGDLFKAASGGWAKEEHFVPGTDEKSLVWFAVVGWPSMKAHMDWRDSPSHYENQKLLEQYKDWWKGLVRVHSSMQAFPRTTRNFDSKL